MTQYWVLGRRAIRETLRTPETLFPTVFIPLFFLVVNVGQAGRIFPAGRTSFLEGQNYAAFQLPAALLLAASFGSAALYLVEDRAPLAHPPGLRLGEDRPGLRNRRRRRPCHGGPQRPYHPPLRLIRPLPAPPASQPVTR